MVCFLDVTSCTSPSLSRLSLLDVGVEHEAQHVRLLRDLGRVTLQELVTEQRRHQTTVQSPGRLRTRISQCQQALGHGGVKAGAAGARMEEILLGLNLSNDGRISREQHELHVGKKPHGQAYPPSKAQVFEVLLHRLNGSLTLDLFQLNNASEDRSWLFWLRCVSKEGLTCSALS